MAISEDGKWCGSLSGGCIEAAVVAEAQRVIVQGRAETVRFGSGSPFIDIRLPCGGGLDLLITPDPMPSTIDAACAQIVARQTFTLRFDEAGAVAIAPAALPTGWHDGQFSVRHYPALKLVVAGQGEEAAVAVALARAYGAEVSLWTHDAALTEAISGQGVDLRLMTTALPAVEPVLDAHSALLLLYHEHEWETELLVAALRQPAFFIGAMGSPATHQARLTLLRDRGVMEADLARITGPVGIIPATRDPATLALSALTQIVAEYGRPIAEQ